MDFKIRKHVKLHVKIPLFICLVFLAILVVHGQEKDVKSLKQAVKSDFGVERLEALNDLTTLYLTKDVKKAIRYGKQAVNLAENIFSYSNALQDDQKRYLKADAHSLLGKAYFFQEKYQEALAQFNKAKLEANQYDHVDENDEVDIYLSKLDSLRETGTNLEGNFFKNLKNKIKIGEAISNTSQDLNISTLLKIASSHEKRNNYGKAIDNYQKAINLLQNQGDARQIAKLHIKIADLYKKSGDIKSSLAYYQLGIDENKKVGDSLQVEKARESVASLFHKMDTIIQKREKIDIKFDSLENQQLQNFKSKAEEYIENKDYQKAAEFYQLYSDLQAQLVEEKRRKEIDSLDLQNKAQEIKLLLQQSELSDLELQKAENEIEKQQRFKNTLIIGSILLLALLLTLYLHYTGRRKAHKKLKTAYDELENTQGKLIDAEQKIKKLLGQQVSGEIAEALLENTSQKGAIERKFVCIMFLDIRGFTPFAEQKEPEEIIAYQNKVFGFMIDVIDRYHGNINQFLGDGFMATFGAPKSHGNDCENAFKAAKEIVKVVNQKSDEGTIPRTRIGIGLHAGHVVAGNVGTDLRKQYSITGNTVITAARIEQLNKEYASQLLISESVFNALDSANGHSKDFIQAQIKGRKTPIKIVKIA